MTEILHLIPECGLANRLRAVASARRICRLKGMRCEVTWNWGGVAGWKRLFADSDDVTVAEGPSPKATLKTTAFSLDGRVANQRLNPETAGASDRCVLRSCHTFSCHDLPPFGERDLQYFTPSPSDEIKTAADDFIRTRFRTGIVGIHIRSTDNHMSRNHSPLHFFEERIRLLAETDTPVFLATDSPDVIARIRRIPHASFASFDKAVQARNRWPNPRMSQPALIEDYMDLILLSRCDYVLGSHGSSYTDVAIALNGDPRCERLGKRSAPSPSSFVRA